MSKCLLTTFDNPYDPIEQYDSWFRYDKDMHYDCCELLDRIARTSDQLTDQENEREIERAIDEIIKYDVTNNYKKLKFD